MIKKWGYSIVVVVIILLVLPWFMGRTAQHQLQRGVDTFNASAQGNNVELTVTDYNRGWFHSQAVLRVILKNNDNEMIVLPLAITHGPIIFKAGALSHFALAAVQSQVDFNDVLKKSSVGRAIPLELAHALRLLVQASFSYQGKINIYMLMPAVQFHQHQGFNLNWAGLTVNYTYDPAKKYLAGTTDLGALAVDVPPVLFIKTEPVLLQETYQTTDADVNTLTSDLHVPSIAMTGAKGVIYFSEDGLRSHVNSNIQNNHVALNWDASFNHMNIGTYVLGSMAASGIIKDFNAQSSAHVLESLQALYTQQVNPQLQWFLLFETLPTVFYDNATVTTQWQLQTPQGLLENQSSVIWPNASRFSSALNVWTGANVDATFKVPVAFVNFILNDMERNGSATQADSLRTQLQQALLAGYVKVVEGRYVSHLTILKGNIVLNNVPFDMSKLQPAPVVVRPATLTASHRVSAAPLNAVAKTK